MDDAGKEGLNTNANVVICYGLPWNPEVLAQLVGRAWGYGRAERPVIFYILLANNTLDIYMYETLLSKRELKEAIFNDLKTDSVTLAKSFNSWEIRDKIRQQLKDCARGAKTEKTV
jgi:SNF2 family DNA or RNA helicase